MSSFLRHDPLHIMRLQQIGEVFDQDALARICAMPEADFGDAFDMTTVQVGVTKHRFSGSDYYYFRDNGSDILAVAHLDTVVSPDERTAYFTNTEDGPVVFSGALDDRLGAYIILVLLPALGITCDILLTVGEEDGESTAEFFAPVKQYNWMIEFDRGGTDVVMYQYDDQDTRALVYECGARVGEGIFSDIAFLEHLEVKGFNWGVGYQDYHGPRSHAFLEDTFEMVAYFLAFHEVNAEEYLPHEYDPRDNWWGGLGERATHIHGSDPNEEEADWWEMELRREEGEANRDFVENPTAEEMRQALGLPWT